MHRGRIRLIYRKYFRFIFIFFIVTLLMSGCGKKNNDNLSPYFPVQKPGLTQMTVLAYGRLYIKDNYFRVKPIFKEDPSYLVIWPPGYELVKDNNHWKIKNSDGKVVAKSGSLVKFGGGPAASEDIVKIYLGYSLPSSAAGPYWIMSGMNNLISFY
jgi:hypothetical protein